MKLNAEKDSLNQLNLFDYHLMAIFAYFGAAITNLSFFHNRNSPR